MCVKTFKILEYIHIILTEDVFLTKTLCKLLASYLGENTTEIFSAMKLLGVSKLRGT